MKRSKILVFILLLAILLSVFVINVSAHGIYVVNKSTNKYHLPDCSYLPSASNSYTIYRDDIDNYPNLSPCGHCRPDIYHSYEPANPGQSSGGSSDSSTSKPSTEKQKETWLEKKQREGTPLFDWIVIILVGLIAWFSGAFFIEVYQEDNPYYYKLSWLGKILLFLLCIISIFIVIFVFGSKGSGIINLVINHKWIPISFIVLLIPTIPWVIINQEQLL